MIDFEAKKREILDRVDILALVGEQVALRRSGKRWVGLCPFHTEKTPSFSVVPDMGIFKCFGCGKGGDVFSFVQARENIEFMDAMRMLADRTGVLLDEPKPVSRSGSMAVESVTRLEIGKVCAWAQTFFRTNLLSAGGEAARRYLEGRGFTEATIELFGLGLVQDSSPPLRPAAAKAGFAPHVLEAADLIRRNESEQYYETFRNRIMFPIRDTSNRVIGFGGRTLADDKAKYLNTRQNALFDKGRTLFGIDQARQSIVDRGRAVIVEGYTDCMACHQAGFTETVASLGTSLTESHVELVRRYAGEMVLVFDSDRAGIEAAERALRVALPKGITVRLARVPEGKDPGEFLSGPGSGERFIELLKDAVEALEFTWRQTWAKYHSPTSDASRQEAVLDFVRMVCEAAQTQALDAIRKGLLINQLAHLLRLDRAEVARLMASLPTSRPGRTSGSSNLVRPSVSPTSGEQGAWVHLLEVVLNEPGLLGSVTDWPDTARITDARDRRITDWVFDCAKKFGEFTLADVLALARDGDDAARIAELATRGQSQGNYESSFRVVMERLAHGGAMEKLEAPRQSYLDAADGDQREVYADGVSRHRHFGPMRLIRQAGGPRLDTNTAKEKTPFNDTNSEPL